MKIVSLSINGVGVAKASIVVSAKGLYWALKHGEEGRGRWQVRYPLLSRHFPAPEVVPDWSAYEHLHRGGVIKMEWSDEVHTREHHWFNGKETYFYRKLRWVCPVCGSENTTPSWVGEKEADQLPDPTQPVDVDMVKRGANSLRCKCQNARKAALESELELTENFFLRDLGRKDPRGNQQYLLEKGQEDGEQLVVWKLSPGYRGGASFHIEGEAALIGKGEEAQGEAGRMGGAACPIIRVNGPCRLTWTRSGRLYGSPALWQAVWDEDQWTVGQPSQSALEDSVFG